MREKHTKSVVVVIALCLLLLLAACGTSTKGSTDSAKPESSATATVEPQSTEDTTAQEEKEEAAAYPTTIKHMKGEYVANEKPKVIAVMDVKFVDQLVALGEKPAGSVTAAGSNTDFPEYLLDKLDGVKVLGTRDEPNLEAVLELAPDVIIMTDFQEKAYESLHLIAPTIVLDFYEDWRDTLGTFAQLTGKAEEGKQVIAAYEEKTARISKELAEKLGDETVLLIRPRDGEIRVHTPTHRTAAILYNDLGLKVPASINMEEDGSYHTSLEGMAELKADHLFLLSDALFQETVDQVKGTETWKTLEPVKNNHVYTVDTTKWIAYYGPIALNLIVDEVESTFLGQQ